VASPPTNSTQAPSPTKDSRSGDVAEIFSKAISERLGGSELQELAMAECNLTSSSIRKIIDGCVISGIQRLSLATNDIDAEGLNMFCITCALVSVKELILVETTYDH
jgi:hypothetical protein